MRDGGKSELIQEAAKKNCKPSRHLFFRTITLHVRLQIIQKNNLNTHVNTTVKEISKSNYLSSTSKKT